MVLVALRPLVFSSCFVMFMPGNRVARNHVRLTPVLNIHPRSISILSVPTPARCRYRATSYHAGHLVPMNVLAGSACNTSLLVWRIGNVWLQAELEHNRRPGEDSKVSRPPTHEDLSGGRHRFGRAVRERESDADGSCEAAGKDGRRAIIRHPEKRYVSMVDRVEVGRRNWRNLHRS